MAERIWHPISKLAFFVEHTASWLADVEENAATLEEARTKPYVLSAGDVDRVKRLYEAQADDLTLAEEQAAAWERQAGLSDEQRAGLETLRSQLTELRRLNGQVLALADELAKGTIDVVMATSDAELGLADLLGGQRLS